MAKLKADAIVQEDLLEYLDGYSDFSFEVSILKKMLGMGFNCEHAGSYTDRATQKIREFDIRAVKVFGKCFVRFAIECKNLRGNYPLIVSCIPRTTEESFQDVVASVDPDVKPLEPPPQFGQMSQLRSRTIRLHGDRSIYQIGSPVGKSCDQVGRGVNNEITTGDNDVYTKWSQALSSADDLTHAASCDGVDRTGGIAFSLVVPIVVVPNGRLWMVEFDDMGNRVSSPIQVERCSYYVNRNYEHKGFPAWTEVSVSHLEFVTENGLVQFITDYFGSHELVERTLAISYVAHSVNEQYYEAQ